MWAISPEPSMQQFDVISNEVPKGCQYRVLSPQPFKKLSNLENRTLINPPAIMAVTESQTAVCFRSIGGKVDYSTSLAKTKHFITGQRTCFCIIGTMSDWGNLWFRKFIILVRCHYSTGAIFGRKLQRPHTKNPRET